MRVRLEIDDGCEIVNLVVTDNPLSVPISPDEGNQVSIRASGLYVPPSMGGLWGQISGDLEDQADLYAYLQQIGMVSDVLDAINGEVV